MNRLVKSVLLLMFSLFVVVNANQTHSSKYKGQESRAIKSLSQDDIVELKKGGGWGLAKAAELNGYPGPSHLLKMKDKINLSSEQEAKIEVIFKNMKENAMVFGEKLIFLEKELNDSFSNKTISDTKLKTYVKDIMEVRSQLRLVHLSTHLQTPKILTQKQIDLYNGLRGYSKTVNPCDNMPEGHDVGIWKKHNGCS